LLLSGCLDSGNFDPSSLNLDNFDPDSFNPSCSVGSGTVITETIPVLDFDSVSLEGKGNIFISQGPNSLRIEAEDNLFELMEIEVDGTKLEINFEECVAGTQPINIYISAPEFKKIEIDGTGNLESETIISGTTLEIEIDGSASAELNLALQQLITDIDGSGSTIVLEGTATNHAVEINGMANINAFDLATEETNITITGQSNCEIDASTELNVVINGAGTIIYTGEPAVSQTINGSGTVKKRT